MALASMVRKPTPKPVRKTQSVTKVENAGLFKDPTKTAQMNRLNSIIDSNGQLNRGQLANYNQLVKRQNKLQFNADAKKNKTDTANYAAAQDSAPARALGGYLAPQNNYNFDKYKEEAGIDPNQTQASLLQGLTTDQYKQQFGYDLSNYGKQFTGADMESADPGYKFRLEQGMNALDAGAAARGGVLGGGQIKAAQQYAQDYASGEFQNAWNRDQTNKQNNIDNFYRANGLKQTLGTNVLNNYQQNWNNHENQRNTYGNYLMNMTNNGQDAAKSTAGMQTGNNTNMANYFTGASSASAQNNWNKAASINQAVQSGIGNGMQLAGMYYGGGFGGGSGGYMQPASGKSWGSTGPMTSYNDINGPGLSTVIA